MMSPPRPWILFLEPTGNGRRNLEILEDSRILVANFKRAGDLVVADRFNQFGCDCLSSHPCTAVVTTVKMSVSSILLSAKHSPMAARRRAAPDISDLQIASTSLPDMDFTQYSTADLSEVMPGGSSTGDFSS